MTEPAKPSELELDFQEFRFVFYPKMFTQGFTVDTIARKVSQDAQEKIYKAIIEYAKKRGVKE